MVDKTFFFCILNVILMWLWDFAQVNSFSHVGKKPLIPGCYAVPLGGGGEIKVSCVWAQHGGGGYRTHNYSLLCPEL